MLWHQSSATDLLFITLRKSEALFSPSTRYRDLALGPSLFHWESHEGERPMAIRWRLERPIPVGWMPVMGLAVCGGLRRQPGFNSCSRTWQWALRVGRST